MHPDNLRDLADAVATWNAATNILRQQLATLQTAMDGDMDATYLRVLDAQLDAIQGISSGVVIELAKRTPESA